MSSAPLLALALLSAGACAHQPAYPDPATACVGLAEAEVERRACPDRGMVVSVDPCVDRDSAGKLGACRRAGAVITLRPEPGLTAEYLQRLADCYVARVAVRPPEELARSSCPLAVRGVDVTARSTREGFALIVHTDDPHAAGLVLSRAQAIVAR